MPKVRRASDNLKSQTVDQDECSQRRTSREQSLGELVAQHHNIPALRQIQIVKPTSLLQRQVADLIKLGLGAQHFPAAVGKFAYLVQVAARDERACIPYLRRMADIQVILIGKQVRPGRG